jgi:putative resolvase
MVAGRTNSGLDSPDRQHYRHRRAPKEARTVVRVAMYARVSSHEHRANLDRQVERLEDYCAAKGHQVAQVVKEIASGVNDARPKLLAFLEDPSITQIVVEHTDRFTRFGFRYLETLLELQDRTIEVVNLADNDREDVLADLVSIM